MDIAREICTDSFYTVNGGLPRVPLTAVDDDDNDDDDNNPMILNYRAKITRRIVPSSPGR